MSTWDGWEASVLASINAPDTPANIAFLDSWQHLEEPTASSGASNNPLNTTRPAAGSTAYNSTGVQNYADQATGASATAATLQNGYYPNILAALRSGNPFSSTYVAAMRADLRTWSGGGYSMIPDSGAAPTSGTATAAPSIASAVASAIGGSIIGQTLFSIPKAVSGAATAAVANPLAAAEQNAVQTVQGWGITILVVLVGLVLVGGGLLIAAQNTTVVQNAEKNAPALAAAAA